MQFFLKRFLFLIYSIVVISNHSIAQRKKTNLELGAGFGLFIYQGDLTPDRIGSFPTMKPGIILSVANILSSSMSVRLNFSAGALQGDETVYENPAYRKFRAFKFSSPVVELSPQLLWNPLRNNDAEKGVAPYLFAGAGIGYFNTRKDYSGYDPVYFGDGSDITQRIAADEQKKLKRLRFVIPAGAGIRYNISGSFAINVEATYRILSTDYLDGFSLAANPERDDHYQSISAGVIYRAGNIIKGKNQLGCPVLKY